MKEAAPPRSGDARHTEEPVPAASPVSGEGETAGAHADAAATSTIGRAGAEAPKGGLPGQVGADLVIDWDRVRRHAGVDADRGVNVKRHENTGGITKPDATPAPAASPVASPVEGAGTPH